MNYLVISKLKKPDIVCEWMVQDNGVAYFGNGKKRSNLRLVFDGETGALKSAEVIK